MVALKLLINKRLRCLWKENTLKFKNFERKIKFPFVIYADFKIILEYKIMEIKISLTLTNIMLLVVKVIY